jgi:hypothetical protein
VRFAICGVGGRFGFCFVAAAASAMAETVASTAGRSGLTVFGSIVLVRATTAMTCRLEVAEAPASDNSPAVQDGKGHYGPYQGRPIMAADKPS